MPRLSLVVFLLGSSLVAAPLDAVQQQAPAATGTAIVAGQVTDATTGRPIGGATVTLANGSPMGVTPAGSQVPAPPRNRIGVAVANAQGRFVFRDVPAGDYWLAAQLDGYGAGASGRKRIGGLARSFAVGDGARLTDVVVPMWRLGAISGAVRDDRGDPVIGVGVWAMRRALIGGQQELTFAGGTVEATDDRGHYRLANLMPGSYVVVVRCSTQTAPVAAVDAYRAAVTSGSTGAMMRASTGTGTLNLSSSGLVIDGWQVSVSNSEPQPLPGPNGTLLVHPTVFNANAAIALAAGSDRTDIDFTLPLVTGVRVSGVLMGPDGPAANHGLRMTPASSGGALFDIPSAYSTTDTAGRFAFFGVPAGSYTIRAHRTSPGNLLVRPPPAGTLGPATVERVTPTNPPGPALFANTAVSVGSAHVDGLALTLRPGATVTGRVSYEAATTPPAGQGLERMRLGIYPLNGSEPDIDVRVDAQGKLTTTGMAPGRYTLTTLLAAPGVPWSIASAQIAGVDAARQAFTIGATDVEDVIVTLTDKTITLNGTVRAATGVADPEATVVVFPADWQAWISSGMSPRRVAIAAPSASGAYDVKVPVAGDYLVVAVPPEVTPEVDREFIERFVPSAVRVSLALGDAKTQALTVARAR